ncbi:hypothetical protein NW768_007339 [Fusarium equiseti]|uniref:Uncharacterized protein n=1 Tax=Fusarium equiseti TaxID=61235 RepID=A0ABQ8R777_FUSEQ|nr:hypothetical protein NW768_007339 [Fusarium equiseti]
MGHLYNKISNNTTPDLQRGLTKVRCNAPPVEEAGSFAYVHGGWGSDDGVAVAQTAGGDDDDGW